MSQFAFITTVKRLMISRTTDRQQHQLLQTTLGLSILSLLLLATSVLATPEQNCHECDRVILGAPQAWWGGKPFCTQACKDRFWERYQEEHPRVCKICNIKVELPGVVQHRGDMTFIVIGNTWDGYCDHCREQVRAGIIDPPPPQEKKVDASKQRSTRPRTPTKVERPDPDSQKPIEYFHKPKIGIKKWIMIILAAVGVWLLKRNL